MSELVLGVGDFGVSRDAASSIKTYALGSCVAVIMHCPALPAAGMIHIALPDSAVNPERALEKPGFFADTGLPRLFQAMSGIGFRAKGLGVSVKLAGGAVIMDKNDVFNIGKRNVQAVRSILWAQGLSIASEDVGGTISRTVSIDVGSGEVLIYSAGKGHWRL
ncbi:MAG: chemotaxis protein CheD [Acidobacteriota bacterium]|jgi:chemotaxis protein CheD|nr:chemotaxis protein CheD [Acidobacteriota bacterium]